MNTEPNAAPALPEYVGNYKVVRELGRGSMGVVYQARQESLARDVAVKLLAVECTRDGEFLERFRREGQIAARLRHPHIVQVYDFSDREGQCYIAMEYLGARNLKQHIDQSGGKLPVAEALRIIDQLLQALEHAHSHGVVHRDVKPANIILTDEGDVALTDFSIAQMKFANRLTQSWTMLGTPEYMAPEQFDGKGVGPHSDLYAVGIVAYEMLAGINPFHGDTVGEVMKAQLFKQADPAETGMAAPIARILQKALEKKPEQRYASASEMRKDLAALPVDLEEVESPPEQAAVDSTASSVEQNTTGPFCPGCGKRAVAGSRFCHHCGVDMGSLVGQAPPVTAPRKIRAGRTLGLLWVVAVGVRAIAQAVGNPSLSVLVIVGLLIYSMVLVLRYASQRAGIFAVLGAVGMAWFLILMLSTMSR